MYPLAHLGIGSAIAAPWRRRLPLRWLLLGTLLPDLIDKPVFLFMAVYRHFHDGGWVPGKRGVAHTLLFLALLSAVAILRRSNKWAAVAAGTATHLLLDVFSKMNAALLVNRDVFVVLCWPFLGWNFPPLPYGIHGVMALSSELLGALLLAGMVFLNSRRRRRGNAI